MNTIEVLELFENNSIFFTDILSYTDYTDKIVIHSKELYEDIIIPKTLSEEDSILIDNIIRLVSIYWKEKGEVKIS